MTPSKSVLDKSFVYIPAASTDVTLTWRRFGWVPIDERPKPKPTIVKVEYVTSARVVR